MMTVAAYAAALPVTFTRASLLAFRRQASSTLSSDVIARVRLLCLRRHRGRRAGRHVGCSAWAYRPAAVLRPVGNGAYIIAGSRSPPTTRRVYGSVQRNFLRVPIVAERHAKPIAGRALAFGSMNVRSLTPLKLDDLLVELRDRSLDVLLLCETWHDANSVSVCRLRADGFRVVERARPRSSRSAASLAVNHGGVAIVAVPSVRLTAIDVGYQPSTFECVAGRVSSNSSSCVVLAVYRPGSSAVTAAFFTELAEVLDRLATFVDPIVLAGDINIRLERMNDPLSVEFCELLAGYGLTQCVSGPTHDAGGTIDVVCTRDDMPLPNVDITDIGLSDHRLLSWSSRLLRPPPVYSTSTRRSWRSFDLDTFHADLQMSALCDDQQWIWLDATVSRVCMTT